jgi:glucose-1-phosphate cytidylyltransferase
MKTVILAGGFGSRLSEETTIRPKPMVEIGGRPILWHIMKIYNYYGHSEFGIAMGYKAEIIKDYFLNYYYQQFNLAIDLHNGKIEPEIESRENWKVFLADTGNDSMTGGRIKKMKQWIGNETFLMSYGDGVSNVNINEVIKFHKSHGKLVTLTAVRPPSRFGSLNLNNDLVIDFVEKPHLGEGWINGGFFVVEPEALDYIEGDQTIWEREPLETISREGQLTAYQHNGYWQCMDTLRDQQNLDNLWQTGKAPWKIWD